MNCDFWTCGPFSEVGGSLQRKLCVTALAGLRDVNLDVQISRQAQYFVDLEVQTSWHAQHFLNLEVQNSWQVLHL